MNTRSFSRRVSRGSRVAAAAVITAASLLAAVPARAGTYDTLGDASDHGSMAGAPINSPIVAMAATPTGGGYWLLGADGGIFSFGDAAFFGSTGNMRLNRPVLSMAATPSGRGYWFVASDGGIFSFGDAGFYGSTGNIHLNTPIVGMAATPSGRGYWLVASDGGIFSFGDAAFYGSTGNIHLSQPIVGMAATPSGRGYWLVASDGGIFSFGDAAFYGSTGAMRLNQPIVGMASSPTGRGYWLAAADGGVFTFGDAAFHGTGGGNGRVVSMVRTRSGGGYWFATADGAVVSYDTPVVHTPAPGEVAPDSDRFSFIHRDSHGMPARWNPCAPPVHVLVSSNHLPAGGEDYVKDVLREVGGPTGLRFVYDGLTSLPANGTSEPPGTILVGWVQRGENPDWDTNPDSGQDGLAQPWIVQTASGHAAIIGGTVTILDMAGMFENEQMILPIAYHAVLLHEFGHAVGLGHAGTADQAMYPTGSGTYKDGDLQGLAWVGATNGCL